MKIFVSPSLPLMRSSFKTLSFDFFSFDTGVVVELFHIFGLHTDERVRWRPELISLHLQTDFWQYDHIIRQETRQRLSNLTEKSALSNREKKHPDHEQLWTACLVLYIYRRRCLKTLPGSSELTATFSLDRVFAFLISCFASLEMFFSHNEQSK